MSTLPYKIWKEFSELACDEKNPTLEELEEFLIKNPDFIWKNFQYKGGNCLHLAAERCKRPYVIEFLVKANPKNLYKPTSSNLILPIHHAVNGKFDVFKLIADNMGKSILNNLEIPLIEYAANIWRCSQETETQLYICNLDPEAKYHIMNRCGDPPILVFLGCELDFDPGEIHCDEVCIPHYYYRIESSFVKKLVDSEIACSIYHNNNTLLHLVIKHCIRQYNAYWKGTVNNCLEILIWIFCLNPTAIHTENGNGQTPLDLAKKFEQDFEESPPRKRLVFLEKAFDGTLEKGVIKFQRFWRECRDNPAYQMCKTIAIKNFNDDFPGYLQLE